MNYRHFAAFVYTLAAFVFVGCQSGSGPDSPSTRSTQGTAQVAASPSAPWAAGPRFFQHGDSVLLYDSGRLWFDWDFAGREPAGTWLSAGMGDPLEVRRYYADDTYSIVDRAPIQRQSTWREQLRLDLDYRSDYAPDWKDLATTLSDVFGPALIANDGQWRWEPRWNQAVALNGIQGTTRGSLHVYRRALPTGHLSDLRLRDPVRVKHGKDVLLYHEGKLWYQWQFTETLHPRPTGLWLAYNPGVLLETRRIDGNTSNKSRPPQLPALSIPADKDPRPNAAWSISVSTPSAKTLDALASALSLAKESNMELRRYANGVVLFENEAMPDQPGKKEKNKGAKQDVIAAALQASAPPAASSSVGEKADKKTPDELAAKEREQERQARQLREEQARLAAAEKAAKAAEAKKAKEAREAKQAQEAAQREKARQAEKARLEKLAAQRDSAARAAQATAEQALNDAEELAEAAAAAAKAKATTQASVNNDPAQRQDVGTPKKHPSVFDPDPRTTKPTSKPANSATAKKADHPDHSNGTHLKEPSFDAEAVIKQTLSGKGTGQLEYQDTPVGKGNPSPKPKTFTEGPQRRYIRGYFGSGTLSYEIPLLGIKAHGTIKMFYENAKPFSEINYQYGVRHGLSRYFYRSGEVRGMRYYRRGRPTGRGVTFYESGRLKPPPSSSNTNN